MIRTRLDKNELNDSKTLFQNRICVCYRVGYSILLLSSFTQVETKHDSNKNHFISLIDFEVIRLD